MMQKQPRKSATGSGSAELTCYMRWWILFWYNNITRVCLLLGIPSIVLCLISWYCFGPGEYLRGVALWSYGLLFAWALFDNDYSNLRKVGLDEYRRPFGKVKQDKVNKLFGL